MTNDFPAHALIRVMPCRVWRPHTGGALLDAFVGNPVPLDKHLPEDWLASTVRAINGDYAQGPDEGLARVRREDGTPGPLLRDVLATDPAAYLGQPDSPDLGVLCKFLDTDIRLPIQCHPDRAFAREHYHSAHGKAECWIILDTCAIDGVEPYLLMGFRPGIRQEDFTAATLAQDIPALTGMLHHLPAHVGDAYFIPGRFPHAIGPGVFMLEVQEPSDWVVSPEGTCGDIALSPSQMWGPLTPEVALECFTYTGETVESVIARTRQCPTLLNEAAGGRVELLVGPATTDCFRIERLTVTAALTAPCATPYHIEVITAGAGVLRCGPQTLPVRRGDTLFVPHGVSEITYTATHAPLIIHRCASPRE
ncbi:MAG TPA: hypothetical protein VGM23_06015 [Armatimonadota bacterium]